jgi:5'-nucleotidase
MPPSFELVVCITSTALFDCSESHEIWKHQGVEAYKIHQRAQVKVPLKPGVGFPLVQSLLALNEVASKHLVEVVLVSRNDSETGERVRYSIDHYKLRITRMSFTCGTDVTYYLAAWKCDLFLSTEEEQVRKVLSGSGVFDGMAAGLVCNIMPELASIQPNLM